MKNLIKLQLRKNFLSFAVILGAILASVPLALAVKSAGMAAREAVNLAMLYWGIAGIPLTALILSGIAGAEAAKEQARNIEQPLPVSQFSLLTSGAAAVLLQLAVLLLAVCAILGFTIPLSSLTGIQEQVLRFYVFSLGYLALLGFTLSYAFKNGIAGAAVAAAAVTAVVLPLMTMTVFQQAAFVLIPLWLIKPAIAALALAGVPAALKLLSDIFDRKIPKPAAAILAVFLLLAAPVLGSFSALAWLNLAGGKVTLPAGNRFSAIFGAHIYPAAQRAEAAGTMLVQRPFTGEVFLIDSNGNRSVIDPGANHKARIFAGLLPDLSFAAADSVAGPAGERWILYMRNNRGQVLNGSLKAGFTSRATVNETAGLTLVGGKEPCLVAYQGDTGYYSAALPPGKDGLKWMKVSAEESGIFNFWGRKYLREGAAAVFRKDGKTLEYRGKRWTVPGAAATQVPVPGVELGDGMNFFVPAKTKDGYATWLCRPDGRAEAVWPDYLRLSLNLFVAPDGTVWGKNAPHKAQSRRLSSSGYSIVEQPDPVFYILTRDGKVLSKVKTGRIVDNAGVTDGDIDLVHSDGNSLWFVSGARYLVKTGFDGAADMKVWRLPEVIKERVRQVSAAADGIFIAAADGVYFMDWDGKKNKIY